MSRYTTTQRPFNAVYRRLGRSETLATLIFLKVFTSTPNLPSPGLPVYLDGLILRRTHGKLLKEIRRTREQEPTLPLYSPNSRFLRPLVNRWSHVTMPLTV